MPAKQSARRTKTKSYRKCTRKSADTCRKSSACEYRRNRSPKCQPKRSRRATSRRRPSAKRSRPASRKKADSNLGALMTESELVNRVQRLRCANERTTNGMCEEGCMYDRRMGCVPSAYLEDKTGKFLADGTRHLSFRSNKKPAFSFKMPVNLETICGDYAGAIRFSPTTGKLVLCYGPLVNNGQRSERPLLSTIVRESVAKNLWQWYQSTGRHIQRRRVEEYVTPEGTYYYADVYGLPAASLQLTWQEAHWLDGFLKSRFEKFCKSKSVSMGQDALDDANKETMKEEYKLPTSLQDLATAPRYCPQFLEKQDITNVDDPVNCFTDGERGEIRQAVEKRREILRDAEARAPSDVSKARIQERLSDFDPFTSGPMNRREIMRKRFNITEADLEQVGIDLDDFDDDEYDPEVVRLLYERKRRELLSREKRRTRTNGRTSPIANFVPDKVHLEDDAGTDGPGMGGLGHYNTLVKEYERSKANRLNRPETKLVKVMRDIDAKISKMTNMTQADTDLFDETGGTAYQDGEAAIADLRTGGCPNVKKFYNWFTAYVTQNDTAAETQKKLREVYTLISTHSKMRPGVRGSWTRAGADQARTKAAQTMIKAIYDAWAYDLGGFGRLAATEDRFGASVSGLAMGRAETKLSKQRYRGSNSSSEEDSETDDDDQ